MDPRQYTYEYRRPRPSNPTLYQRSQQSISSNVNNSLTHYLNNPIASSNRTPYQIEHVNGQAGNKDRHEMTPTSEPIYMSKNRSQYLQNPNKKDRYEQIVADRIQQPIDRQSSMPKIGEDRNQAFRAKANSNLSNSNLSNYGSNLLNNAGGSFKGSLYNEQEVYKKQQKKFNIITLKPNNYDQTIKQYPKLTLEDKDAYFYKKIKQQQLFEQQHYRLRQLKSVHEQPQSKWQSTQLYSKHEKSAGKPTFMPSSMPYEGAKNQPNSKALNNLDQLAHI